jgi:hypothetical protein
MIPYLLYYFISLSILFFNKKLIPISYAVLWFFFIGFRDTIGTDYFSTLDAFQRSYIDFDNPFDSFYLYNLVDLELTFKILSTIIHYLGVKIEYAYILIAFFEALIIFLILSKVKHKHLFLIYFLTMYTLTYPMNAIRQGFSVLILVYALNNFSNENYLKRISTILISCFTHYASIPIILLSSIRFKNIKINIIILLIFLAIFYNFNEIINLRWPTEGEGNYKFKGYGIKLLVSTFFILIINYFVVERKFLTQQNIVLILLTIATYLYNPVLRLYSFYSFVVLFSNLFKLDKTKISINNILLLLSMPLLALFSEWLEISRFYPLIGTGNWLPYKSFLF